MMATARACLAFVAGFTLLSCTSAKKVETKADPDATLVSADCKAWTEARSPFPRTTFIKQDGSISYFDFTKRVYAIFTPAKAPFTFDYSESGWIHMSSGNALQSLHTNEPLSEDDVGALMEAVMAAANDSAKKNRWFINPERNVLMAMFTGNRCAKEPSAIGAFCDPMNDECTLLPKRLDKPGLALECLRGLGFGQAELARDITKTCQHFDSPKGFVGFIEIERKMRACPTLNPNDDVIPAPYAREVCFALPTFLKNRLR
ncbi:MAG: hypothetical protein V4760_07565 [Bdellovibrionota bacterium]